MINKFDNFLDKIINKIKAFILSVNKSIYDFIHEYEKLKIQEDKIINNTKSDLNKIESVKTFEKRKIEEKVFQNIRHTNTEFDIYRSPYSCASYSCTYEIQPYIAHQDDKCNVLNRKREYKIFYRKKYKSKENYFKAIERFYKAY